MTIDQIIAILANGIPNGLGYILFLYLFYETRKDNRDILRQTREDAVARETMLKQDASTREAMLKKESENREMWFRQAVEKMQANEATMVESQRRMVDKLETMDERLQRMELAPRPRRNE